MHSSRKWFLFVNIYIYIYIDVESPLINVVRDYLSKVHIKGDILSETMEYFLRDKPRLGRFHFYSICKILRSGKGKSKILFERLHYPFGDNPNDVVSFSFHYFVFVFWFFLVFFCASSQKLLPGWAIPKVYILWFIVLLLSNSRVEN